MAEMSELADHCKFLFVDSCGIIWNWSFLLHLFSTSFLQKVHNQWKSTQFPKTDFWMRLIHVHVYIYIAKFSLCQKQFLFTILLLDLCFVKWWLDQKLPCGCCKIRPEAFPMLVVSLAVYYMATVCLFLFVFVFSLPHYSLQCMLWMCT